MSYVADQSAGSAPTSPQFAATLQRAYVYAEEQAHRLVTVEHLLLALTEDPDCVAVLRGKAIDLDHLRNEIAGLVSRNNDRFAYGDAGQPIYGAELLRVLNTASGAASVRRPIDGALVLAAMIADGSTPAAELIKLYGLTFEDAARAPRPGPEGFAAPIVHPPLATLRSAARESALGLRKRAPPSGLDILPDDPLSPPTPPLGTTPDYWPGAGQVPRQAERPAPQEPSNAYEEPWPPQRTNGQVHEFGGEGFPPVNGAAYSQVNYEAGQPVPPPPDQGAGWPEPDYSQLDRSWHIRQQQPQQAPQNAEVGQIRSKTPTGGRKRRKLSRPILIENIPRKPFDGVPIMVEARVARHDLEMSIVDMADSGRRGGHGLPLSQAVAVRLRSVDGAIGIEAISPETHWVDGAIGLLDDDFASWRWMITPNHTGSARLQFVASVRAVGEDGAPAEAALPDQTVDVQVITNFGLMMRRLAKWATVAVVAGGLGSVAEHGFGLIGRLLGH